ncbi:MAG: SDR family NAD(P)-dependent oxidoreductase [Acidimicrobiales bacterium]|nr:SDR family NAD(P)-dependent oxidoreductase [Acidimicrobiales bacterium]
MQALKGKVAVVTGAGSGIGRAMALRFAKEGANLVLADIEDTALTESLALVRDEGVDAVDVVTDVAQFEAVEALAERTLEAFGTCHVLCNNAGVGGGGSIAKAHLVDWQWVLGVNLWGVIHGITAFLPILEANGEDGHIVNTASVAGLVAGPGIGPYNASKFAVVGISETLFHELGASGSKVGVSVLCPGYVSTNIATSQRNRPSHLQRGERAPGDARSRNADIAANVATGMDPAQVADLVVRAIYGNKFWVITHPELLTAVRRRNDALSDLRNPEQPTFG